MQPATEFLTPEECAEVDQALLTSFDKFTTRVTIYALRSLKQVANQQGVSIEALTPAQIEDWVYQDESLQAGMDQSFKPFFTNLVVASLKPLCQTAAANGVAIAELSVAQVIAWFEAEAKQKLVQRQL
jgi:hypothetical protein